MKILLFLFLSFTICLGQYSNNLITNGTFEADANWSEYGSFEGGEVQERSSTQAHSGTYSWHINVDDNAEGTYSDGYSGVVSGEVYRFKIWIYVVSGQGWMRSSNGRFSNDIIRSSGTGSWSEYQAFETALSTGTERTALVGRINACEAYFDDFTVMRKIDTLWIDGVSGSDTDGDTVQTLTEAFEERGAHSGGYFITTAGTYSESITIDSSFTKWEASGGNVTITSVDFNSVTASVDYYIYNNIGTASNDENITLFNEPSTEESESINRSYNTWKKFPKWKSYDSGTTVTVVDTTITLNIITIVDNGTDSLDATATNDLQAKVDSTYWLINQDDGAVVTWANADYLDSLDGWVGSATLPHGQTENDSVSVGVVCIDTLGDTTAISTKWHRVTAYDETAPSAPSITATGVQYDSVRLQLTASAETGATMGVWRNANDTSGTAFIDWVTLGNLDGNITGYAADNIIDADGDLQGSYYDNYFTTKGYQIGFTGSGGDGGSSSASQKKVDVVNVEEN